MKKGGAKRRQRFLNWLHNLNHILSFLFGKLLVDTVEDGEHLEWRYISIEEFHELRGWWGERKWYWPHRQVVKEEDEGEESNR